MQSRSPVEPSASSRLERTLPPARTAAPVEPSLSRHDIAAPSRRPIVASRDFPTGNATAAASANASYAAPARLLHWLMAALLVALVALGFYMSSLPVGAGRSELITLHKSLGLTAGLLFLLRLGWRLGHAAPPLSTLPAWQRIAARLTHALLYVLMLALPLTGYLRSVFSPYPVRWFGWPLPTWAGPDKSLNALFGTAHEWLVYALLTLVALHLLALLQHGSRGEHFILRRMWPSKAGKPRSSDALPYL